MFASPKTNPIELCIQRVERKPHLVVTVEDICLCRRVETKWWRFIIQLDFEDCVSHVFVARVVYKRYRVSQVPYSGGVSPQLRKTG